MTTTIIPVPALNKSGWVRNISEKADLVLAYFFESDKKQSFIYEGAVSNIQWYIEEYGNNIINLTDQIQNALETYLKRYYTAVTVNVTDNSSGNDSFVTLKIFCSCIEGNKKVDFGRLLNISDKKLTRVISLNNLGE